MYNHAFLRQHPLPRSLFSCVLLILYFAYKISMCSNFNISNKSLYKFMQNVKFIHVHSSSIKCCQSAVQVWHDWGEKEMARFAVFCWEDPRSVSVGNIWGRLGEDLHTQRWWSLGRRKFVYAINATCTLFVLFHNMLLTKYFMRCTGTC